MSDIRLKYMAYTKCRNSKLLSDQFIHSFLEIKDFGKISNFMPKLLFTIFCSVI